MIFYCLHLRELGFSVRAEPQGAFYLYVGSERFGDDAQRLYPGAVQPGPQQVRQVFTNGLFILSAMLAVGRLNRDRRRVGVEAEGLRRQASDFIGTKAGARGQAVQHRAIKSGHARHNRARFGRVDHAGQFVIVHRPAIMPPVELDVVAGQVNQGVLTRPPVAPQPAAEVLDGPQVMVARL